MHGIYLMNEASLRHLYYKAIMRGADATAKACERAMMRQFNKVIEPLDKRKLSAVA